MRAVFAGRVAGYAVPMTDEQHDETKQGPANPKAEGLDAPTPPEGPQRQDGKGEGHLTGGHDDEASGGPTNDRHASESGGHTIALEDEQPDPEPEADKPKSLQEENAGTALDQPSGV